MHTVHLVLHCARGDLRDSSVGSYGGCRMSIQGDVVGLVVELAEGLAEGLAVELAVVLDELLIYIHA